MPVLLAHAKCNNLYVTEQQALNHYLTCNTARLHWNLDRIALHQFLRLLKLLLVLAFLRWILVIPLHVLVVPSTAPSARIPAHPSSIRIPIAVIPIVPCRHELRSYRQKPGDSNRRALLQQSRSCPIIPPL